MGGHLEQEVNMKFEDVVKAPISYWRIALGIIVSLAFIIFLRIVGVFLYWMLFGEGALSDEKYHPVASFVIATSPLVIILSVCGILLHKNIQSQNPISTKFYMIIMFTNTSLFIAFQDLFYS